MGLILSRMALFLVLLATGGFIVYIFREHKATYRWSHRSLLAGFVSLTLYLAHESYVLGVTPALTLKTALSFFAWCVLGAYLVFQFKFRLMVLGSFISPLAAVLMIFSSTLAPREVVVQPAFKSLWLSIHIWATLSGDGMFAVACMAAIMYLIQENQIKQKKFGSLYTRLPSLQTLDSINHYALIYGFALLTVGIMIGAVYAQYTLGAYWRWDPKEVWSVITWLFYAVLLHERLTVGWRGRRVAMLSIIAFGVLLFTFLGASLWLSDYHSFKSLGGRPGL